MCADCTVRQTGRECDRESEAVNEGKNRKKDQGNWLNADSLKDFSLEHGTKRVKSGNRSDSYSEREVEKIILEQENKGGSVGQNTTGEINEEIRGDGKQGVSITGTVIIIVEQGNEKLRGASKKGEEEKKETGQESKTKGEKLIQSTQTDGDSGLASSKDTARTNYASKGQTPYISAEGSRQESADSNAALSYRSSHGSPAFSSLTPPLTRVHKGLTTTAAGPQIQTTDLSATFIAEPGFTATGRPTTAPVNTGQQGFTEPQRVVRPTTATTTTTNGPTIATLPGVSQHHHSPAKLNISSNTKTGVKPLGTNPKIKTAKVNNSPKPAHGLFSDKKTKYDQKQKPPYHKPLTKPRFKGSQLFQGLKPSQRTDISPADLNLKENPTNQNQPNIQTPKSPSKLPVQRPMSHRRHQPVKMNNPEKHLPTEQKPKSTQITNVTQRTLKKSAIEKKRKQNQTPEITHGLRDIEGRTENKQKTNFTPQLFHEADAELLENADGPLAETNSVNSEAGSKPVLPDPNPDSRKKFPQIKPKPAPAPKTGLNQSDPDLTTDSEAEHNLESDKTSHIDRGFKPPLPDLIPNPTVKPVSDGAPGAEYDRIPSPLPRHRSPSTPTAEPGATSAQRSTPFFPLKSGSKPKTSGPVQNSQMILPPSSGPVKQLDDVTNSWGDTEVSTIKMTTLDLKSSISQDGRAIPHLHTLPGDFMVNPNSRIMSRQKSQTTAAPPSIQVTDRPNRLIPWVLSSVPPSDSPTQQKQAANVDSKLHHNQEETTKSQIYDSNKVMNTIPSSSSADLRSTNPANSGPQPLAPDVSTDSARELQVKINQVAAFFNNSHSTSGRHPERHSAEQPEDKQRGSRLDGINSKLLTRIPSKVTVVMRDCSDYLLRGKRKSGVYIVTPDLRSKSFPVFCDMELLGGGWTLLQRRQDGSVSFNRTWAEYRSGFGELDGGEFWLGNNVIHLLTRERDMMLRVELEDFEGEKGFAEYSQFRVASERLRYTLTVGGYSGNAGNALRFSKSYDHNHRAFTTLDRDHDRYPSGNCAAYYSSGWWFDACMAANLNGRYYTGRYKGVRDGIYWGTWHNISSEYYPTNNRQSFKSVRMMIRPKGFMSKTTQS
ncbi:mucin-2-like isoform X2 [Takifugu flavidus]|nr:mucin-2-like isoform X2 [Takifugu flavidus]